jgi:replicative DNA helicase
VRVASRKEQHLAYREWLVKNVADPHARIPTGLHPALDRDTAGLGRGEVALLGALFGSGKTTAGCNVSLNAARAGYRVLYVSAEESAEELRARLVARLTGVPVLDIFNRKVGLEQMKLLEAASKYLAEQCQLNFASTDGAEFESILSDLTPALAVGAFDMVVMDNLQAFGQRADESRPVALEAAVRSFRDLCRQTDVAGVMLTQVSNEGDSKAMRRGQDGQYHLNPMAWKPRWSGDAEGPADKLIYLFSWEDLAPEDTVNHGRLDGFTKKNRVGRKKQTYTMRVDFAKQFIGTDEAYQREFTAPYWWQRAKTERDVLRAPDQAAADASWGNGGAAGSESGGVGHHRPVAGRFVPAGAGEETEFGEAYPF